MNVSGHDFVIEWSPSQYVSSYRWCGADEYQVRFNTEAGQELNLPWQNGTNMTFTTIGGGAFEHVSVTPRNLPQDGQDPWPGEPMTLPFTSSEC